MTEIIANFAFLLIQALNFAIFGRILMSWISPQGKDPLSNFLIQTTEPILRPIRQLMPKMGMFDLSPMVALLLLNLVILPVIRTTL